VRLAELTIHGAIHPNAHRHAINGIRTPLGIKVTGPTLQASAQLARQVEEIIENSVPGTRNALADRASGGRYVIYFGRVQAHVMCYAAECNGWCGAIGGENISMRSKDATASDQPALSGASAIRSPPLRQAHHDASGAQVSLGYGGKRDSNDGRRDKKRKWPSLALYISDSPGATWADI